MLPKFTQGPVQSGGHLKGERHEAAVYAENAETLSRSHMKRLILICALLFAIPAFPADVTVAWDAPSGPVPDGYKIYVGTATGVYGAPIDVGNVLQYTITNLQPGNTYYIAATCYKATYNDSGYSNEISKGFIGNPGNLRIIAALVVDEDGNVKMKYLTPDQYAAIFFRAT